MNKINMILIPSIAGMDAIPDKNDKLVYLILWVLENEISHMKTTQNVIIEKSGLSLKTTRQALNSLIQMELVDLIPRTQGDFGKWKPAEYALRLPEIKPLIIVANENDPYYQSEEEQDALGRKRPEAAPTDEMSALSRKRPEAGRERAQVCSGPIELLPINTNTNANTIPLPLPEPSESSEESEEEIEYFEEEPDLTPPVKTIAGKVQQVIDDWNRVAKMIKLHPAHVVLDSKRNKLIRDRLKNFPDRKIWNDLFQSISACPYLARVRWFTIDYVMRGAEQFEKTINRQHDWILEKEKREHPKNEYRDPDRDLTKTIFERFGKKGQPK